MANTGLKQVVRAALGLCARELVSGYDQFRWPRGTFQDCRFMEWLEVGERPPPIWTKPLIFVEVS